MTVGKAEWGMKGPDEMDDGSTENGGRDGSIGNESGRRFRGEKRTAGLMVRQGRRCAKPGRSGWTPSGKGRMRRVSALGCLRVRPLR